MNTRELLITTIALQYREKEKGINNPLLPQWVLDTIGDTAAAMGADRVRDTVKELKIIIKGLIDLTEDTPLHKKELMNKVKLAVAGEEYIVEVLDDVLVELTEPQEINKETVRLRKQINEYRRQVDTIAAIKKAGTDIEFRKADARGVAVELLDKLNTMVNAAGVAVDGMVQSMSLKDKGKLADVIKKGKETSSSSGIMRTGWRGLNRMTGEQDGIRRGDLVCFGALQHNFKSGTLLTVAKQIALYNDPFMIDPTKKPLIIHISLENNVEDNVLLLYRSLIENETGKAVSTQSINVEDAAEYIEKRMSESGYHIEMLRVEPGAFGIRSFIDTLENFRADGYEIHLVAVDYMNLMGKQGCHGGNDATMIRDLFRKARAYCNPKLITILTAHQLSPEAKYLLRQGCSNFVQEIAGKGYWDSCKSIDQEFDLEVIQHIEIIDGVSYLTFARGKHRKSDITPIAAHYYVQPFHAVGSLLDDINLPEKEWLHKLPSGGGGLDEGDISWG